MTTAYHGTFYHYDEPADSIEAILDDISGKRKLSDLSAELLPVRPAPVFDPSADQTTAALLAGIPLVGLTQGIDWEAVCGDYIKEDLVSTKWNRAVRQAGGDYGRPRMTSHDVRMKKLSIETCRTHPVTGDLLPPLEPWTCDNPNAAIRLYAQIVRAPDGTFKLSDFDTPAQLDHVRYMQTEKLVVVEDDLTVIPLGDAHAEPGRRYPGAPVPDEWNKGKKQLRDLAEELIIEAFRELCAENSDRHSVGAGRVGITNRDICYRANVNKGKLRCLDEYRYLTPETVRRCINGTDSRPGLLDQGKLTELEPPRRVREDRTWKTLPRVYEVPLDIMTAVAAPHPTWRTPRRERFRNLLERAA